MRSSCGNCFHLENVFPSVAVLAPVVGARDACVAVLSIVHGLRIERFFIQACMHEEALASIQQPITGIQYTSADILVPCSSTMLHVHQAAKH